MNPRAHVRISASTGAGFCGPMPGRLARWLGARPLQHHWRIARRARVATAGVFEMRFECTQCGERRAFCTNESTLWELGIELPEAARESTT